MATEKEDYTAHWYVMHAYNAEFKVEKLLERTTLRCYIPKRYMVRQNRYGKVRVLLPVIPSLVFVYGTYQEINAFQKDLSFFHFVTAARLSGGHSTLKVPDKEMEDFIRVTSDAEQELRYYRPEEINLQRGQRVRIIGGPFDGVEGVMLKVKGIRERRLVVSLPKLLSVAATYIEPEFIQLIEGTG